MLDDIIVLKFGDSVLHGPAALPTAVHEIYRWYRRGWRVVALVSALGETTERLVQEMQELTSDSSSYACTRLFATGEQHAAALLGIALDRVGVPARVIDPRDISFTVRHERLGDESATVDARVLHALFSDLTRVIVVPSGYGHDAQGQLQPLSPGGSDLTAIYLAQALHATRCRLLNDTGRVDEPSSSGADTASLERFAALGYAQALELGSPHIDPTAIGWLARHATSVEIAPVIATHETVIGPYADALSTKLPSPPTRVLILGLGTVGGGVYERLTAMPNHFRVVGALVRERAKHHLSIAADTLQDDVEVVAALETDVVVDALSGFEPSRTLVQRFLRRGISVISANKTLIAAAGPPLRSLAAHHDAYLCYSAAVGGGTPMLEALRREAHHTEVRSITGILNGTCNFILDRCSQGDSLEEAIRCAHAAGFAEADPMDDLSGQDAARKLRILARHAFGQELHALEVDLLDLVSLERLRASLQAGQALRQIARAWMVGKYVFGQVRLEAVPEDDAFGQVRGEWNRLIICRTEGADIHVVGRGAGRWPTTEAVIADLLDVRFAKLALARRSALGLSSF